MAEPTLYLEVLTPERSVFAGPVRSAFFKALDGCLGVLPGHAPLVTRLGAGDAFCTREDGQMEHFYLAGGFAEVVEGQLRLLADTAERGREIDIERARRSRQRAEQRLFSGQPDIDYARAAASLKRSLERLRASRGTD